MLKTRLAICAGIIAAALIVLGFASTSFAQDKDDIIRPLTKSGSAAFLFNLGGFGTFGVAAPAIGSGFTVTGVTITGVSTGVTVTGVSATAVTGEAIKVVPVVVMSTHVVICM